MKTARWLLIAALPLVLAGPLRAETRFLPTGAAQHMHVAQMGMGGVTSMIYTNSHTLFYNPALLNRQRFALEITPVQAVAGQDLIDIAKWARDNADSIEVFDQLTAATQDQIIKDAEKFDNKWVPVNYAPYFGLAFKHFGIGAYGSLKADVKVDEGVFVPALGVRGYTDVVAGVGYGWTQQIVGRKIELGATVRVINRRALSPMRINISDADSSEAIEDTVRAALQDGKTGFGLDVGAVHEFPFGPRNLTAALAIHDLVGSLDGTVKPGVTIGALYPLVEHGKGNVFVKRLDVAAEIDDAFNRQGISLFSRINAGMEASILGGFLKVRGGIHQGYPVAGAGLSLGIVKFDYAYYTEEMGTAPGMFPQTGHRGQISFGW